MSELARILPNEEPEAPAENDLCMKARRVAWEGSWRNPKLIWRPENGAPEPHRGNFTNLSPSLRVGVMEIEGDSEEPDIAFAYSSKETKGLKRIAIFKNNSVFNVDQRGRPNDQPVTKTMLININKLLERIHAASADDPQTG